MTNNPVDPEKLIFKKGRAREWSAQLAKILNALSITVPQYGYLAIDVTATRPILRTTRPIPAYVLARTGGSGIPIRNASTGAWGEAAVTLYDTTVVSNVRRSTLGTRTAIAYNDTAVAIPASKDVKCIEQGGDLIVIAVIC